MPRALPRTLRFLVVLIAALAGPAAAADPALELGRFAHRVGLTDVNGFVEAVESLRTGGHLPPRYVTKRRAERADWRPGLDLCRIVPGDSIGGDRYSDHAHALPYAPARRWREADLDERCGRRGAHRLIWSNDGLYFVTVDHYRHFIPVP